MWPRLTIIDRYIARELLLSFASVIFVLLTIVLSTEVVHLLKWVSQGTIPITAFTAYLSNSMLEFAVVLIPLSLLMGILLAFGRMYRDSEMAAIMSAGIGPMQCYRPLLMVAVPITLILLLLMMYAKPQIAYERALISAEVQSRAEADTLLIGQFNRSSKNAVMFLESKDKKSQRIDNVFFQQRRDDTSHVDLAASTSTYYNRKGHRYMMMHDGVRYTGEPGAGNFDVTKYREYGVYIDAKTKQAHLSEKTTSTAELWKSDRPADRAELQWRLTLPVATIIVAIMALPLSHTDPRSGRFAKLALALVIYLLYSNLLGVGRTWILKEQVPVWIGTWWVHLIAIGITLYLFWKHNYFYRKPDKQGQTG